MFVSNQGNHRRRPRVWLGGLGFLGACLGLLLTSNVAFADPQCGCVSAGISIWPSSKQAAPRNTHVWVRLPARSEKLFFGKYQEFKNYPNLWTSSFTLKQIKVVLLHKGQLVPALRLGLKSGEWRMLVIQPQVPLLPNQRYDVHLGVGAWGAVIGHFTTNAETAGKQLPAAPVKSARYMWERRVRGKCLSPSAYTNVQLQNAPDPVRAPLLGIWAAGPDGKIRFNQPPNLVLPAAKKQLFLGRSMYCSESNFAFPGGTDVVFGIRAGNLAGKWGPPSTVSFAKGAPIAPWTWSPTMRIVFWSALFFLIFLIGVVRAWFVQRPSFKQLDDFAFDHSSIKSDVSWLALRKMVEKETPLRRTNTALFVLQMLLVFVGLYVLLRSMFHFVGGHTPLTQLTITFGSLALFLTLSWLVNLIFTARIRGKRHEIGCLEVGPNFQKPCTKLLKGWRKKGAAAPKKAQTPGTPSQKGATP